MKKGDISGVDLPKYSLNDKKGTEIGLMKAYPLDHSVGMFVVNGL